MKNIYCPKCGKQLPVTAKFCSMCGHKINYANRNKYIEDDARAKNQDKGKTAMAVDYKAEFTKLNFLNFLLGQKFIQSDGKTEAAFLELMWRWVNASHGSEPKTDDALKNYFITEINSFAEEQSEKFELINASTKRLAKIICKHKYGGFFNNIFNPANYSYLFVAEYFYICSLYGWQISANDIEELRKLFSIKKAIFDKCKSFASSRMKFESKHAHTLIDFTNFLDMDYKYSLLPVINIGICATMSAGKSTLVNALLGYDFLPARNEATTACITSVHDNDYLGEKNVPAISVGDRSISAVTHDVDAEILDDWNGNQSTNRIVIQADLENISSSNAIVAVHDTPGPNNSGDNSHHDTTINFFAKNKMDAIIYVVNVEHAMTTDGDTLLRELQKKILSQSNIPVIFVLNKADSIDNEKENFSDLIFQFKEEIAKLGFDKDSNVIPVSAKAARLFKMALKGKADRFTEKEKRDFSTLFEVLKNDDSILKICGINQNVFDEQDVSETISVGRREFSVKEIRKALANTGLINLENVIEKRIHNK